MSNLSSQWKWPPGSVPAAATLELAASRGEIPALVHEALKHVNGLGALDVDVDGALLPVHTIFESRMGEIRLRFETVSESVTRIVMTATSPLAISGPVTDYDKKLLQELGTALRTAVDSRRP